MIFGITQARGIKEFFHFVKIRLLGVGCARRYEDGGEGRLRSGCYEDGGALPLCDAGQHEKETLYEKTLLLNRRRPL